MSLAVTVTEKAVRTDYYAAWEHACGAAVRASLGGAESVVIADEDGAQYYIVAEPVEDNS